MENKYNHAMPPNELLSMLALAQNLHLNEKEKTNNEESSIKPEFKDKINILEILNSSNVMSDQLFKTTNLSNLKMIDNFSSLEEIENNQFEWNKESKVNTLDEEIYTFGNKHRSKYSNNQIEDNQEDRYNKLIPIHSERLLKMDQSSDNSINLESNRSNTNFFSQSSNPCIIKIYKAIFKFQNFMTSVIPMINTFTKNFSQDLENEDNLEFLIVYEKCFNSIFKIKSNFLEIFNDTEKELDNIFNDYSEKLRSVNDNPSAYRSLSSCSKEIYPPTRINSSIVDIAKMNYSNDSKIENKFYDTAESDKKPSRINHESDSANEILKNQFISSNSSTLDRNKDLIESITAYYKESINSKNDENKKLTETVKYYENMAQSSKNLIEDMFNKNKLLKEKLIKYKKIIESKN